MAVTVIETSAKTSVKRLIAYYCIKTGITFIYFSIEIPELADHGVSLPPNMQGLTDDQIMELKLKDEWEDRCIPSGGAEFRKDELGRRNGHGSPVTFKVYI